MNTTRCSSCGAPIIWTLTTAGSRMPVDAVKVDGGHYLVVDGTVGTTPRVIYAKDIEGPGYVSHFATCPTAAKHRRPKGGAAAQ